MFNRNVFLKLVLHYRTSSCGYLRYSRSWSSSSSMEFTWNLSCCSFNNWNMASSCFLSVLKESIQDIYLILVLLYVNTLLKAVYYAECERSMETWKSKLILNFTATSLGIPSILMAYFISLEKLVEDRIPNGMWVMKDMQKIICWLGFQLGNPASASS